MFHLESSQTGTSLFTHEADADAVRMRMAQIIQTLLGNALVDRRELCIFKNEFAWHLNVDILVLDELGLF